MNVNPERLERFREIYTVCLQSAVDTYPLEYPWAYSQTAIFSNGMRTVTSIIPKQTVGQVVDRMMDAVVTGSYSKDGYAFKSLCRVLSIPCTYKAINAWLNQEGYP